MESIDNENQVPPATKAWCTQCNWKGTVSDCNVEYDQDGWENPLYPFWICPECSEDIEF